MEKQLQSVAVAVAIGVLLWAGSTLVEIKNDVAVLKVQAAGQRDIIVQRLQRLEEEIEILRRQHDPYYKPKNGPGDR